MPAIPPIWYLLPKIWDLFKIIPKNNPGLTETRKVFSFWGVTFDLLLGKLLYQ